MMEYKVLTSSFAGGLGIHRTVFDMLYENAKRSGVNLLWADVSADNPDAAVFPARLGVSRIAVLPEVGYDF
jgi:predicted GNAT superfamily acetyltransferase